MMSAKVKLALFAIPAIVGSLLAVWVGFPDEVPEVSVPRTAGAEPGDVTIGTTMGVPTPDPVIVPEEVAGSPSDWRLRVEVVDARGLPAGRASLRFLPETGRGPRVDADAQGRAELRLSGAGRLVVQHGGHVPNLVSDLRPVPGGVHEIRVQLEEGRSIAGRVLDPDGEPVPKVRVRVRPVDVPDWYPRRGITARTGPDGQFEIRGLAAGPHRVEVQPGGLPGFPPTPADVCEAGDRTVEIRLHLETALRIRLLDADTGRAIRVESTATVVDAEGETLVLWSQHGESLDLFPPIGRRLRVRVTSLGYRSAETPELVVRRGEGVRDIELRLEKDPEAFVALTLVLTDDLGVPIPRVQVGRLVPINGVTTWSTLDLESPDGCFAVTIPPGRQTLEIRPHQEDREESTIIERRIVVTFVAGEKREMEVTLTRGASLRVTYPPDRVAREGGGVMSRSGVLVKYEDGCELPRRSRRRGSPMGEILYRGLPAGKIRIALRRADGRRSEKTVEVRPGETAVVAFPGD